MNRAERFALAKRHTGILTLGVNAHDRPVCGEQIGNDRADALARARRGNGDEMGRAVIAEQSLKWRCVCDASEPWPVNA